MKHLTISVAAALMATATLQAQTYNEDVRLGTWSVFGQGGMSGYHGARNELFDNSSITPTPDLNVGFRYNSKPWVRVGATIGYTMIKSTAKEVLSQTTTEEGYKVGDYVGTLEVRSDRIQNRNDMHLFETELNADFNVLQLWPYRKAQWVNLYAGVGLGFMHGWNKNTQTWSYQEKAVAQGDSHFNIYTHAYLNSLEDNETVNSIYFPFSLSLEFDVSRNFTVGVIGLYKRTPISFDKNLVPRGIYSGGVVLRYNFTCHKSALQHGQQNGTNAIDYNGVALQNANKFVRGMKFSEENENLDKQGRETEFDGQDYPSRANEDESQVSEEELSRQRMLREIIERNKE